MRFLKRHKKLLMSYGKTALITVLFLAAALPLAKKVAAGSVAVNTQDTRFVVLLNGEEIGCTDDKASAEEALLAARTKLSAQTDGLTLVEADLAVVEENRSEAVLSVEELSDKIYTVLAENAVDTNVENIAYTVRIDDFTVTLASKEDVTELLEMIKDKYSSSEFSIELTEENNGVYTAYKTSFVSADKMVNEAAKVLSTADGDAALTGTETDVTFTEGVLSVDFVEEIEVIATREDPENIISIEEAYELLTKEHAAKGTYTVASGDCLSSIARDFDLTLAELLEMNPGIDESTMIYVGDVLTVTVPASEISVRVIEEKSYDEEYNLPVQYVDNPNLYVGTEKVQQEGSAGKRSVVALVTYINGLESEREIISEKIAVEATAKIVERGTKTLPTYIKPISSTYITQYYSSGHKAVDWAASVGTAVKAAASGTVITAGWSGSLGYCVEIRHSDGSVTRYGHLSRISVSSGQAVTQGQVIAYSGNTGYTTGPHLHFAILINGVAVNPLNYVQ